MIIVHGLSFMQETKKGPMISTYDDINVGKGASIRIENIIHMIIVPHIG